MDDRRKNLRRHIKAARDWLLQAEKSIESENDVQGDLKIMLAKAELQNAEKHRKRTYFKKILSFTAAALIAFGVYQMKDRESAEMAFNTPAKSVTVEEKVSEEVQNTPAILPEKSLETEVDIIPEQVKDEPEIYVDEVVRYEEANFVENDLPAEHYEPEPVYIEPQTTIISDVPSEPRYVPEIKTPSEDMQKLMQSAGQILRAE